MGRIASCVLLLAVALGLGWSAARAADWAIVVSAPGADEYDIDLASVSRTGAFVHSWVQEIHAKPRKDPVTGKSFVKEEATWDNDCKARRYLLGEQLHFDAQGKVVGRDPAKPDWKEAVPDSVASSVLQVACRATEPLADKPLLDDIFAGRWIALGPSPDGSYRLSLKLDQVMKLDEDEVVFLTRSDYARFRVYDGLAIRYNVSAYVLNCKTPKVAFFAADAYWTPTARAVAQRAPVKQISLQPIPPASYVGTYSSQICAAAVAPAKARKRRNRPATSPSARRGRPRRAIWSPPAMSWLAASASRSAGTACWSARRRWWPTTRPTTSPS